MTLEAIADETLWIWNMSFGLPGCLNDIKVLNASPLFNKIISDTYPLPIQYVISGVQRDILHLFSDGIFPKWPMFV